MSLCSLEQLTPEQSHWSPIHRTSRILYLNLARSCLRPAVFLCTVTMNLSFSLIEGTSQNYRQYKSLLHLRL